LGIYRREGKCFEDNEVGNEKKKKNSLTPCIKALFFFVKQKLYLMEKLKNMH
jgi:hypothetical protein